MLPNTFTWSISRHRVFQQCRRRYWLAHYGAWGGWTSGAGPEVRARYIEKGLHSVPSLLGVLVHEAAEWGITMARRGHPPSVERARERYGRQARRILDGSRAGWMRHDPKRHRGLAEHYYGGDVDDTAFLAELDELLEGMFAHPVYQRVLSVPERVVEMEDLQTVLVGGIPVWVSPDVVMADGHGGFAVVDWKTGRHQGAAAVDEQLAIYVLHVLAAHLGGRRQPERVAALHADLRGGGHRVWRADGGWLARAEALVAESARAMRELLSDVASNTADEARFPGLPDGDPVCARCALRRSCGRESGQKMSD